jgi:hypothetical protein
MKDFKPARLYSLPQLQNLDTSLKHQVRTQGAASDYIDLDRRLLYLQALDSEDSVLIDMTKAMKTERVQPGAYYQVVGEYSFDFSRHRPLITAQFFWELQFIQCNIDYYQREMMQVTLKTDQLVRRFNS